MFIPQSPTLQDAQIASRVGKLHEWVLTFLRSSGKNLTLADRLEQEGSTYQLGLIDYPIEQLKNNLGSHENALFFEDAAVLTQRVDAMSAAMRGGWQPPAIIATNLWRNELAIADGSHRAYALQKQGRTTYPTILYFRDVKSRDHFLQGFGRE